MIDYKRNNSVKMRNTHESVDPHDLVKTLLVRILRKQNPDNKNIQIYTEYDVENTNDFYPDVLLKKGGAGNSKRSQRNAGSYYWEIQEAVSSKWTKKMEERYGDSKGYTTVPLKEIEKEFEEKAGNV